MVIDKIKEKSSRILNSNNTKRAKEIALHSAQKTSETGKAAAERISEALDTASGKKMYKMVQEQLEVQIRYNDIFAFKLEEALKRIAALEQELKDKKCL